MTSILELFASISEPLGIEPFTSAFVIGILLAAIVPGLLRKYDKELPVISRAALSGFFIITSFIVSDYLIWASELDYASMTLPYFDHLVFQVVDQMLGWAVLLTLLIVFGLGIVVGSVGGLKKLMDGEYDIDIFQ